jgi:hypothetical protein
MHTRNLYLLHFTCMFDYNYKSYFILSWNLNILRKLFLSNISYRYTCIVSHRMSTTTKENIDNWSSFVMLLNVSDFIDVIFYWNTNNCEIKKYTSILETLILYVVEYHCSILNKVYYAFSKSSTIHDLIDNMNN